MRPKFAAFFFVSILIIMAVVLALHLRERAAIQTSALTVQTTGGASGASAGISNQIVSSAQPATNVSATPMPLITKNRPSPQDVVERFIENKNVPVEFYGQVIDQDSNALAGVSINAVVVQLTMPDPTVADIGAKNIPVGKITGTDGRFEISGVQGASFDLESIQKNGYEAETPKRGHGPTGGTFDQPVIFKMWNTNIHEQLITGKKAFQIVPDGRPYFIDLTSGTISESGMGDLKVWVNRPQQITYGQKYDWSCEVDAVNGGLVQETLGTSMYMAPVDGYNPSFQFEQKVGSGWGDTTGQKRFYLRLSNGQEYGQISIELEAYYNDQTPGLIRLSYAINPSGSRILR